MRLLTELRQASRRLAADPWAAGAAIVAAALGAGLNAAVFAVAYGVLLRPLPYPDPAHLVVVNTDARFVTIGNWQDGLASFESSGAYARDSFTVYDTGDPRLTSVAVVDQGFFDTLRAPARAGRTPNVSDGGATVVVSERFARQAGAAIGDILGQRIVVGEAPLTVVGVMPPAFAFPSEQTDVWMPMAAAPAVVFDKSNDSRRFHLVGRLKAGTSLARVRDEAIRAAAAVEPQSPRRPGPTLRVTSLQERVIADVRPALLAFTIAAAIVLVIACANVATILVGRTLGRGRELAVRRALGASPRTLLVSVAAESLLVTSAGAILGILIAFGSVRLVTRWAAGIIPRLAEIQVDWVTLGFALATTAVAALLSAVPAFRTAGRSSASLRVAGSGARIDRRTRGALIVVQIALAVVLLAGGALLTRTIVGLLQDELGVAAGGTVVTQLMLTSSTSFTAADRAPLVHDVLDRIRALPGVSAAGAGSNLPPDNGSIEMRVSLVGRDGARNYRLSLASATPGYLPALGARMVEGRDFRDGDGGNAPLVAVLSQSAARDLMPEHGSPVGRELPVTLPGLRDRGRARVIGVVSDIKYGGLEAPAGGAVYVMWSEFAAGRTFIAIRTPADPAVVAPALRAILRERDPRLPLLPVRTLEDVVARSIADRRLRALLGGSVALLAFAIAMVGLAGSLMRMVSERREELAIRAALGASPARAVWTIVSEGATLSFIGVALGCAGALGSGRALRTLLHGVSPHDPLTLAAVCAFVAAISLLACYLGARRAALVDPLLLLRAD